MCVGSVVAPRRGWVRKDQVPSPQRIREGGAMGHNEQSYEQNRPIQINELLKCELNFFFNAARGGVVAVRLI